MFAVNSGVDVALVAEKLNSSSGEQETDTAINLRHVLIEQETDTSPPLLPQPEGKGPCHPNAYAQLVQRPQKRGS